MATRNLIEAFDFKPGRRIANKYEILKKIGSGWEGEVYKILELRTGIERAANQAGEQLVIFPPGAARAPELRCDPASANDDDERDARE